MTNDDLEFCVLINAEEQYSLWPAFKAPPAGWTAVGKKGTKQECSAYVDEVWKDMRPKSLREAMARDALISKSSLDERSS